MNVIGYKCKDCDTVFYVEDIEIVVYCPHCQMTKIKAIDGCYTLLKEGE